MAYQLTKAERDRLGLAVHEATHAVVGVLNGGTVERARLTDNGTDGICEFTDTSFEQDRSRYRRALVAAAGPAAAAIFGHGDIPTARQLERYLGNSDREELRLAALHSHASADEQLWEALPVVRRRWRPIGTLAAKIFAGHEIGHDDVLAALGITDDDGATAGAKLAMIASGGTPRPRPLKSKAMATV
ncbi:M50 family metallopeptidase [Mycolicibacterium hippocampi]|uniref:Uncharacterized protein n=1 Tax=Mycolicibacterium hippocampi TaxID=659824 RepID=A0A850PUG2_9MYCO|nr:M50 family metallopeptidase [Mycolicibacterium hippocampi]NVN51700.1 hypothetical protein [Mycolicibacterium hippocampi]